MTRPASSGEPTLLHVCEALGGGVLGVVSAVANETGRRGIPTILLYGRRAETPTEVARLFETRVHLAEVPGWGRRTALSPFYAARAARTVQREMAKHERGVLHLHSTFAGIVGRSIPRQNGWRVVYTPHGYAFLNPSHPPMARRAVRGLESFLGRRALTLACSETEGEIARGMLGLSSVQVVPNGIATDSIRASSHEPADGFVVAAVGRAAYQRRPDLFAETAGLLRDRGFRFVWHGDGPAREVLQQADVLVTGWLARDEAMLAFERANVVAHFSAFEGLPLALLEAMASGRAVVASDLPVIREVVGDAALLVDTAVDAATAIERLHADAGLRATLGARARQRVEQHFSQRKMLDGILAVYADVARSGGP
jgi:glycosyltransferase involved in cell wall biosynthesis